MAHKQKWNLHVCVLDPECRYYAGWVWRVHLNTPWRHLGAALRPRDRFARVDGRADWFTAQRWPREGDGG